MFHELSSQSAGGRGQKERNEKKAFISPDHLQNTESSPPIPPSLGGRGFQSPPEIASVLASDPAEVSSAKERARRVTGAGDLGGKNLRDETQETYVYTVGFIGGVRHIVNYPLRNKD